MQAIIPIQPPSPPVKTDAAMLKVGGFTPFSSDAFPGKTAAEVFVQGCPWHCGYCNNPHLQPRLFRSPISWKKVLDAIKQRMHLVEAVVFTGGEPTLDPALGSAIRDVRDLGLEVGLQCGGAHPEHLEQLLPLVDWIGLDVKAPFASYDRVTGILGSGKQALASIQAVLASDTPYEIRTTVHPALLNDDDIMAIAQTLADMGVEHYALQAFRPQGCRTKALKTTAVKGYPAMELVRKVAARFPDFTYRPA